MKGSLKQTSNLLTRLCPKDDSLWKPGLTVQVAAITGFCWKFTLLSILWQICLFGWDKESEFILKQCHGN